VAPDEPEGTTEGDLDTLLIIPEPKASSWYKSLRFLTKRPHCFGTFFFGGILDQTPEIDKSKSIST
jgi:hypothetical protein